MSTFAPFTVVVGGAGFDGTSAANINTSAESTEYPCKFLD
jgi:hypothetical protein